MSIDPDTKDWTWVIERPCPDCGFDPCAVTGPALPDLIHDNTRGWYDVLDRADVGVRPAAHIWSPLEYAAHVRDVHRLFAERVAAMVSEANPQFANWDQDATAVEEDYGSQDPGEVMIGLVEAAADVAAAYAGVVGDAWQRPGRRSNGSEFTVLTLGIYHLHDVVHHLWDVRG